jgi:hypothetical protein
MPGIQPRAIRSFLTNKRFQKIGSLFAFSLVLILLGTPNTSEVGAFLPTELRVQGASSGKSHEIITKNAITAVDKQVFGVSELTQPMKKAMEEIADANQLVDVDFVHSARHVDGEAFPESQILLTDLSRQVQVALRNNNLVGARFVLGQALHTVQDFYSHTNWVEAGNTLPNPDLGRPDRPIARLPGETPTCDPINPSLLLTDQLTSGYYSGETRVKPNPNKCSHGGLFDLSGRFIFDPDTGRIASRHGINKDSLVFTLSPHARFHLQAAALAEAATQQFIIDIQAKVTPRQFSLLLGGGGPMLAFLIDPAGSGAGVIETIKQQAIEMVNNRLGTDQAPSRFLLARLSGTGAEHLAATDDPEKFKAGISAFSSSGDENCPALSMTGILQALLASDERGDLFIFTGAHSNENALAGDIVDLAFKKQIKIFPIIFGHCSPVDPLFLRIANETGGQLFNLPDKEVGKITKLIDRTVRSHSVTLLSIADSLSGTAKHYTVPVDSGLKRITFSVSGTNDVVVKRADGAIIKGADRGVDVIPLDYGAIFSIAAPAAGEWDIAVNGVGDFSALVSGEATLDLTSFRFFEPGGRPGHEGFFPVGGRPLAGRINTVGARMDGNFNTAFFELRTKAGIVLQPLHLTPLPDGAGNEFFEDVTLPESAFLVYVTGIDRNGTPYQRVLPGMIKPQTLQVTAEAGPDLQAGESVSLLFRVKNFGASDTFQVSALDDQRMIQGISPSRFTLDSNQAIDVTVKLLVPADASPGFSEMLTFSAERIGGEGRNFTTVTKMISGVAGTLPTANAGGAQIVECADPRGTAVVLDGSRSDQPQGDRLRFEWKDADGNVIEKTARLPLKLPLGAHTFTLTVDDGKGGIDSDRVTVTVRDTIRPKLKVSLSPIGSRAANQKWIPVIASIQAADRCDPAPRLELVSIVGNEPDQRLINGNKTDDIREAAFGTDDRLFLLSAGRSGAAAGRIYRVTYRMKDASGNEATATAQLRLP